MISSITIKNNKSNTTTKITGVPGVTIAGDPSVSVIAEDNSVTFAADSSNLYNTPYAELYTKLVNGLVPFPYITKISGVNADTNNMVWLLGGKTFQVDRAKDGYTPPNDIAYIKPEDNVIYISDMGQTVDYPRIYRAVYDMLNQIRLWVDAHKDTVLLTEDDANSWWSTMKDDPDYSKAVPKGSDDDDPTMWKLPEFRENRSRSSISAIGPATNILGNYWATVALWNYIVNQPLSSTSVRMHPADSSGIYAGISSNVPRLDTGSIHLSVQIDVSIDAGQVTADTIDDFRLWVRMPSQSCVPNNGDIEFSDILIEGAQESGATGSGSSVLDSGLHLLWPIDSSFTISYDVTIPEAGDNGSISNVYTIQSIVEIIPYMICPYDGENGEGENGTYSASRKSPRASERGEIKWRIRSHIYKGDELVGKPEDIIKSTTNVEVCEESDSSE